MKRVKNVIGVTLLEVMLVLAIAAMIIVMSIRYYQTAMASQSANTVTSVVQAILATADSLSQTQGGYSTATINQIPSLMPKSNLNGSGQIVTPWGGTITPSYVSSTSFSMNFSSIPDDICPLIKAKFISDNHFTTVPDCSGALILTYVSNP